MSSEDIRSKGLSHKSPKMTMQNVSMSFPVRSYRHDRVRRSEAQTSVAHYTRCGTRPPAAMVTCGADNKRTMRLGDVVAAADTLQHLVQLFNLIDERSPRSQKMLYGWLSQQKSAGSVLGELDEASAEFKFVCRHRASKPSCKHEATTITGLSKSSIRSFRMILRPQRGNSYGTRQPGCSYRKGPASTIRSSS